MGAQFVIETVKGQLAEDSTLINTAAYGESVVTQSACELTVISWRTHSVRSYI